MITCEEIERLGEAAVVAYLKVLFFISFVRLLALRSLLAYCASLG
jgi:hypothetical protein